MLAIGNNELGGPVKKGDTVVRGELEGVVKYGTDGNTGKEVSTLGYVSIGGIDYMVSLNDRLVGEWKVKTKGNDMTTLAPDFAVWAENVVLSAKNNGTAHEDIERALEQAYNQGVALGKREGYDVGLNQGWALEQDKSVMCFSKHCEEHMLSYPIEKL